MYSVFKIIQESVTLRCCCGLLSWLISGQIRVSCCVSQVGAKRINQYQGYKRQAIIPKMSAGAKKRQSSVSNGDVVNKEAVMEDESKKAVTSFIGMYLLVSAIISLAWCIGYIGFSFIWVFLSIAALFVVWKSKIHKMVSSRLLKEEANLYRKRAFRQDETAEWFNFMLNRWWVFSSANIEELVKKRLDERLWDIRPSFIDSLELSTFNVGEQTPNVKNVRTFECSESSPGKMQPISWFNVHRPPKGLDQASSYQVVVEGDLTMMSDDFKMIFRGRLGSSKVGVGFDLVVEDLHIAGTIQAIICLSMDIPFPHVQKATICFIEKPDVTFNIRMLRALSLMEIPLIKSWIHTNVMEGLTKAMVDPASVDITVKSVGPTLMGQKTSKKEKAQGVLTVHMTGYPPKDAASEDIRYCVLSIGARKRQSHEVPAPQEWEDVCSFFIYNLATERIKVKSKCMRLITSITLEQNEVNLSSFPFQVNPIQETTVENKDGSKVVLKMEYTPLPTIDLTDIENRSSSSKSSEVAGVLYVNIHGASNVLAADKTGASDPYCVLFCDRKRVLTTPFIPRTRNPHWESWTEFFVADYTRSSLSFYVYDWDGTNAVNDDFLGNVHLNLTEAQPKLVKTTMTLGYNRPDEGFTADKSCGQITVSAVFTPVASVNKSEKFRDIMKSYKAHDHLYTEDLMSPSSSVLATAPNRKSTNTYLQGLLEDKVIVTLTILQGKDLVAMDRNGYSDPFCVVTVASKKVYTTAVKKKTLFPKWNETVTTELTKDTKELTVDMYDKDFISHDFMGKLTLTVDQLKELSFKGTSDWYSLDKAKTGKIQLRCQVIAKDTLHMPESPPTDQTDEVFDYPSLDQSSMPAVEITDSSFQSSVTEMVFQPEATSTLHKAPRNGRKYNKKQLKENRSSLERSTSDLTYDQLRDKEVATPPMHHRGSMKHASSVNSINIMQSTPGDSSVSLKLKRRRMFSSSSNLNKLYSVAGKVLRLRGNFPMSIPDAYVKVKLEHAPGNRLTSLFHNTRIIAKSQPVSLAQAMPDFNTTFEVDKGSGVAFDAVLTFEVKHSSKEHLASKSFSLVSLLGDADSVCKWLPLGHGLELEVSLAQGHAVEGRRRSGSLFKSFSFLRDKEKDKTS